VARLRWGVLRPELHREITELKLHLVRPGGPSEDDAAFRSGRVAISLLLHPKANLWEGEGYPAGDDFVGYSLSLVSNKTARPASVVGVYFQLAGLFVTAFDCDFFADKDKNNKLLILDFRTGERKKGRDRRANI
jgi:hypothetical protein